MIKEFIKEYRKLMKECELRHDGSWEWLGVRVDDLVERYETELNIQSLKELKNETIKNDQHTL